MYKEIDYYSGMHNLINKELIDKSVIRVINSDYDYNYVSSKGIKGLREEIVKFSEINNISYHDVLITNSSSNSIKIIASLLNKGDTVLVEEFTYFGARDIFLNLGLNIVSVKLNSNGIDLDDLKEKIEKYNPKMIYVIPTFNNPSGVSWDEEIREGFISVIKNKEMIVIEDDPYSLINFSDTNYTKLIELDNKIIYISSFSKYIAPGFSVGYIICKANILDKLYLIKKDDLCSNGFIEHVVLDYLKNNDLKMLIKEKMYIYKQCLNKSKRYLKSNGYDMVFIPSGGVFISIRKDNKIERFNICYMK